MDITESEPLCLHEWDSENGQSHVCYLYEGHYGFHSCGICAEDYPGHVMPDGESLK